MEKLLPPDKILAARVLGEVGFADRLIAYRLSERLGAVAATLYSFPEVVSLLHDPCPRLDWNGLTRWVREVLGDLELAAAMEGLLGAESNEGARLLCLRELLGQRLVQCHAVAAISPA